MNCLSLQQIYIQLRNEYRRRQSVSIATMKIMQKYNHVYELLVFWMASNSNHTNPPPAVAAWTYSTTGPDWGLLTVSIGTSLSLGRTPRPEQTACCVEEFQPGLLQYCLWRDKLHHWNPRSWRAAAGVAVNTAPVCVAGCTGVGTQLHRRPSHPVLDKAQGFSRGTPTNDYKRLSHASIKCCLCQTLLLVFCAHHTIALQFTAFFEATYMHLVFWCRPGCLMFP